MSKLENLMPFISISLGIAAVICLMIFQSGIDGNIAHADYVYKHMENVKATANELNDKFSCYPTRANSFENPKTFKSSIGNSCKTFISDNQEMKLANFKKEIKVYDDQIHVILEDFKFQGVLIETANNNIVYKIEGLKKYNQDEAYLDCQFYLNENSNRHGRIETIIVRNEESVTEQNPCGIDKENNPLIYIGKSKPSI